MYWRFNQFSGTDFVIHQTKPSLSLHFVACIHGPLYSYKLFLPICLQCLHYDYKNITKEAQCFKVQALYPQKLANKEQAKTHELCLSRYDTLSTNIGVGSL